MLTLTLWQHPGTLPALVSGPQLKHWGRLPRKLAAPTMPIPRRRTILELLQLRLILTRTRMQRQLILTTNTHRTPSQRRPPRTLMMPIRRERLPVLMRTLLHRHRRALNHISPDRSMLRPLSTELPPKISLDRRRPRTPSWGFLLSLKPRHSRRRHRHSQTPPRPRRCLSLAP